jgi:hypothetical protein
MHAKAINGLWKLEREAFDFGIKLSIFMIHVKPGSGLQFLKSVWGELSTVTPQDAPNVWEGGRVS